MPNERIPDFIKNGRYDEFVDTQIDPFLRGIFDKIATYNQLLDGNYLDSNEINEIMNDLDNEWRGLLHGVCRVSGIISFMPPKMDGMQSDVVTDYYLGRTLEFGGVLPVQGAERIDYEKDETRHAYTLGIRFVMHGRGEDGTRQNIEGVARPEDIVSIGFPELMSLEGARGWLAYHHEADIIDLDVDLLDDPGDECATLLKLAGHSVDIGALEDDPWSVSRSVKALDMHTNSLLSFDRHVPYLMTVDGFSWDVLTSGDREQAYAFGTDTMASIRKVLWLPPSNEEPNRLIPHIDVLFHGDDKDAPVRHMAVPVSALSSLQSFRRRHFRGDVPTLD